MEIDILAARRAERPKALGRGLAADGAGIGNVGCFGHAVQIRPGCRPRKGGMQVVHCARVSSRPSNARAGIHGYTNSDLCFMDPGSRLRGVRDDSALWALSLR